MLKRAGKQITEDDAQSMFEELNIDFLDDITFDKFLSLFKTEEVILDGIVNNNVET
jgi:Ca2+-binding EF-hand superfamily protein